MRAHSQRQGVLRKASQESKLTHYPIPRPAPSPEDVATRRHAHQTPVDRRSPLIFSFPFMLPIRAAQPEPIGITLATALPRFVITMPSAPRSSSKLRHCSLNFEALIRR